MLCGRTLQLRSAPWTSLLGGAPRRLIDRALDLPQRRHDTRQDALTALFTAPYLSETCTRELNRARRFNRPVALLLLDVDALGELNAEHGRPTGDLVLQATAHTISNALREYDVAARLNGGLFGVLLPETDLAQAQVVAERVRRGAAEQRHEVPGSVDQAYVTLSIGAAIVGGQGASTAEMFDVARTALARAKREGGNQIEFEAVHAPTVLASDSPPETSTAITLLAPKSAASSRRAIAPTSATTTADWLRTHAYSVLLCGLAAAGLGICSVGAIAELDWPLLAVMLSLSLLAGISFYFRSLPLALALAAELNRLPARLTLARYWRMWPRYVALGAGGLVATHAYLRFGLTGALVVAGFGLLMRHLAGRYVDRTLESVRKLRNANAALEHQAFHDPLTNLPNRALFAERLQHAMVRAGDGSVAVLFLDLDNFKTVNDTLGHAAGDALLIAATQRLLQCVRREDTIARLGGDEFTVLLEDLHDPSDAARMAERIGEALRQPFELVGQQASVSSSIGIALDTDRSHAPDDLLREADLAMYRAKSGGKARYEIFDTGMAEHAMQRLGLETDLRHAVEHGQMRLAYQPVVEVSAEDVVALEAAPHWHHPDYGPLEAAEFERIAEDTGVASAIGRWVLTRACADAHQWQRHQPGLPVHVRLSARQLDEPDLVETVRAALATTGLQPELLWLDVPDTTSNLAGLSALGVRLRLDNDGGPFSLDLLTTVRFGALKLPAATLDSIELTRTTSAVASALGLAVTAVGGPALPLDAIASLVDPPALAARAAA